jgi:hypothetical protein
VRRRTGTADWGVLVFYSNTGRTLIYYPIMFKHLAPVNHAAGAAGDVVASGSSQHSTLRCAGVSVARCAVQGQQRGALERRREGGTRERGNGQRKSLGLLVVRQQGLG